MDIINNKINQKESSPPAISGGYLALELDGKIFYTVAIPIPNLLSERNSDSQVSWFEEFEDEEGNEYKVEIDSSIYDLTWNVDIIPYDKSKIDKIFNDLSNKLKFNIEYSQGY